MGYAHSRKGRDSLHERLVTAYPVGVVERMSFAVRKAYGKVAGDGDERERPRRLVHACKHVGLARRIGASLGRAKVRRGENVVGRPFLSGGKRAARIRMLKRQLRVRCVEKDGDADANRDRDDDDHRDDAHSGASHPAFALGALDIAALAHAAGIGAIVLA